MSKRIRIYSDYISTLADLEDYGCQPMSIQELMEEFGLEPVRTDLEGWAEI